MESASSITIQRSPGQGQQSNSAIDGATYGGTNACNIYGNGHYLSPRATMGLRLIATGETLTPAATNMNVSLRGTVKAEVAGRKQLLRLSRVRLSPP